MHEGHNFSMSGKSTKLLTVQELWGKKTDNAPMFKAYNVDPSSMSLCLVKEIFP